MSINLNPSGTSMVDDPWVGDDEVDPNERHRTNQLYAAGSDSGESENETAAFFRHALQYYGRRVHNQLNARVDVLEITSVDTRYNMYQLFYVWKEYLERMKRSRRTRGDLYERLPLTTPTSASDPAEDGTQ